jgi:hypothetical protein
MSEVLKYERVTLGDTENRFLFEIMGDPKSAYSVYSILKGRDRPMAYKNVYTRIKRLEELKLIEKIHGKFARRAINYGLTSQGLFYLLSQFATYTVRIDWAKLLDYYADSIILRTLVLPYFEIATLRFPDFNLWHSVLSYLRDCYLITLEGIDYIQQFTTLKDEIIQIHYDDLIPFNESPATTERSKGQITPRIAVTVDKNGNWDNTIKSAINGLKKELEWQAKELAFSLITKPPWASRGILLTVTAKADIRRTGKAGVEPKELGRDKRFMKLLREVKKDFDRGFEVANAAAEPGTQ